MGGNGQTQRLINRIGFARDRSIVFVEQTRIKFLKERNVRILVRQMFFSPCETIVACSKRNDSLVHKNLPDRPPSDSPELCSKMLNEGEKIFNRPRIFVAIDLPMISDLS